MNIFITGFPGTGKSTTCIELQRQDQKAYDSERITGFSQVVSRETGMPITMPNPLPRGWFDTVGANVWSAHKLENLLTSHDDVFLCGHAQNIKKFIDMFDKTFVLTLDTPLLEQRVLERTNSSFGKEPEALADILDLHKQFDADMMAVGAIAISPIVPPKEVVQTIIRTAYDNY